MSFGDHLEELRRRVIWSVVGIIPLFAAAFVFGRPILGVLIDPAREQLAQGGQVPTLLQTGPFETFGTVMHIAIVVTIVIGAPWILYQLWLFVAPGLYAHERRFVHILLPMSAVLAVVGVLFLYFVILPVVLQFFISFSNRVADTHVQTAPPPAEVVFPSAPVLEFDPPSPAPGDVWVNTTINQMRVCIAVDAEGNAKIGGMDLIARAGITQQYRISEYVKTILNMALGFAAGFQVPVVVLLLGWAGIVQPGDLRRFRKHICGVCFIASAVLTPADPVSMVLLGFPLYGLFELGMFLLRVLPAERVVGGLREPSDAGDE